LPSIAVLDRYIGSLPGEGTMPDDKSKRGKPDRSKVAANEPYEVNHIAKKFELPPDLVKNVIKQEGPSRAAVERYLDQMKRNGR
jgi:hypothetical protein